MRRAAGRATLDGIATARKEHPMKTPIQPYQGSDLMPTFDRATIADAMHHGVMSSRFDVPVVEIARMMAAHHIHAVVVEGVRLDPVHGETLAWGVVSDLDLARAAAAGIDDLTAGDVAATEPLTAEPSMPLVEAAQLMDEHATAHIIVVEAGRPVGMVSTLDIAGALARGRG
jgi:CBS domain-containing protein